MRKIILLLLFTTLGTIVKGQDKFQYLTIEFEYPRNDSIRFSVDASGVDTQVLNLLKPIVEKQIKYKKANELYNHLGRLGWELYLIEDFPNTIRQRTDNYSGRPIDGLYNLFRDSQWSKRLVYFKIKLS